MWGCFLMSGVKIMHFLKDWWKSIPIHQNYTMALSILCNMYMYSICYRFHEVMALRTLMRAVPSLRENGDEFKAVIMKLYLNAHELILWMAYVQQLNFQSILLQNMLRF